MSLAIWLLAAVAGGLLIWHGYIIVSNIVLRRREAVAMERTMSTLHIIIGNTTAADCIMRTMFELHERAAPSPLLIMAFYNALTILLPTEVALKISNLPDAPTAIQATLDWMDSSDGVVPTPKQVIEQYDRIRVEPDGDCSGGG